LIFSLIKREIAKRVETTEKLRVSEEQYRNLFSNMSEGFGLHEIILDVAGKPCDYRFLELNDAFEKMTGISREKALGRNVREILPDIDPGWIETYGRVALTGEPVHYVNYSTPLGRWYETYGFSPRKNQFAVVFYDITERKKAEEALRQSEERLKRAQEIAHLGSWELDLVSNELTWSDEAYRIFGLRLQEFGATYEAFLEAVHPDDRIAVDQAYTESIRDGRDSYEIVHRVIKRASGEIRIVHEKCEHFRNESGQIIRSIGMVHDITERVQAEVELHRTLEELKSSNAELEQFAYVASHDLQEPLRGIAGLAQILQQRYQGQLDSQADEFIDLIVDGTQRMQTLINDLLAYSRIGRRGEAIRSTGAEAALKAVMQNLSVGIREYGATITNDSLPTVKADATQLIQLFQNLISNAVKFRAERPPRIHIGVSDAGDCWQFSIRDNGIGIEPQYFERIFQVFQRLHTRREYKGTGIGLAICKKIIERHGGRIWVESEIGHGTTFYFTLPKGN
jgi:PAS domain S-box-containing protein